MIPRHVEGFSTAGQALAALLAPSPVGLRRTRDELRRYSPQRLGSLRAVLDTLRAQLVYGESVDAGAVLDAMVLDLADEIVLACRPAGPVVTAGATGEPQVSGAPYGRPGERQTGRQP